MLQCSCTTGARQQPRGFPLRADLADMLINGRQDVAMDRKRAFALVQEGACLGCHHGLGVMALWYWFGPRCLLCATDSARSLSLARASKGKGSNYGHSSYVAEFIVLVKEQLLRITLPRLCSFGWLQRRTMMRCKAISA